MSGWLCSRKELRFHSYVKVPTGKGEEEEEEETSRVLGSSSMSITKSSPDLFPISSIDDENDDQTKCLNLDLIVLSIKELELLEKVERKLKKVEQVVNCGSVMKNESVRDRITKVLHVLTLVLDRLQLSQKKWECLKSSTNGEEIDGLPRQSVRKHKLRIVLDRLRSLCSKAKSLAGNESKTNRGRRRTSGCVCGRRDATAVETENVVYDGERMMEGDDDLVVTFLSPSLQNRTMTDPTRWTTANGTKNRWRILLVSDEEVSSFGLDDRGGVQGSEVVTSLS